jgi:hypothetical protein
LLDRSRERNSKLLPSSEEDAVIIFSPMFAYVKFTYPCGQTPQDGSSNHSASEPSHW